MRDREPLPRKTFSGQGYPSRGVEVIPTGSLRLDIALRLGGVPRGRIIEIFGPISSGKTTICQHIIAEAQSLGEICAFIDVDHTFDVRYAQRCGVDLERLIVSEPMGAEQALETAFTLTSSRAAGVVVVDSINSLVTEAELTAKIDNPGEPSIDLLVSQTLQRMVPSLEETRSIVLFTNRSHPKSVIYHKLKDNPAKLALKLHAAIRLKLTMMSPIKINNEISGQTTRVHIVKNTLAPCFDSIELDIMYNEGIRKAGEILDLGEKLALIEQQDSFYYYNSLRFGPGREVAIKFLNHNDLISGEIEQVIRQRLIPPVANPPN